MIPDINMYSYLSMNPQLDSYALIAGLVILIVILLYITWKQPTNITRQPPPPPKPKTKQKTDESENDYKLAA